MMATAPDELMAYGVFLTNPEGVKLFGIPVCYAGPMEAGERLLKPLRSLEYLAVDMVGPMSYCAVQSMFDPGFPPGRLNYWKSSFLKSLSDPAIELLTTSFESVPSPFAAVALEPFGGAVSRVGVEETAFPHRGASYSVVIVGMWADPAQSEAMVKWTRGLWTALQPHSTEAVYVNYLDTDDTARVSAAYGSATFKRLQAVKQKYDPDNFFRMNQNIRPVTSSASPPT
jgi:hypothetical protein